MPKKPQHITQATSNEQFYTELNKKGIKFFDWKITILFYTILHFADAYAAQNGYSRIKSHQDRDQKLYSLINKKEYLMYDQLKNASVRARYEVQYTGSSGQAYWSNVYNNLYLPLKAYFQSIIT